MKGKKILAAIVTFNRLKLLERCLMYLKQQTINPDIIVINNNSTDGTEEFLKANNIPFITQENSGSSGGWFRSIEEAVKRDYDYVWLMDDDGFPEKNALEILANVMNQDTICASSIVIKENKPEEFVFGFPKLNRWGNPIIFSLKRKYYKLSELYPSHFTYPFAHLFNGALINLKQIHLVGNIDLSYFMYGDEVDYFFRMRLVGKVISVLQAKHYHPDVSERSIEERKVYYFIRNTIILNIKYFDHTRIRNVLTVGVVLYRILNRGGLVECLSYLLGKNKKYFYTAIRDGLRKNKDRRF